MRLSKILINKENDEYRVIDSNNCSRFKGTSTVCDTFIESNVFFVEVKRRGTNMGTCASFKTEEEAKEHKSFLESTPSTYVDEEFYIISMKD